MQRANRITAQQAVQPLDVISLEGVLDSVFPKESKHFVEDYDELLQDIRKRGIQTTDKLKQVLQRHRTEVLKQDKDHLKGLMVLSYSTTVESRENRETWRPISRYRTGHRVSGQIPASKEPGQTGWDGLGRVWDGWWDGSKLKIPRIYRPWDGGTATNLGRRGRNRGLRLSTFRFQLSVL